MPLCHLQVNGFECCILKIPTKDLNQLTHQQSLDLAFGQHAVLSYIGQRKVRHTDFVLYPGCDAILSITLEQLSKEDKEQLKGKGGDVKVKPKKDKKKKKKQKEVVEQ